MSHVENRIALVTGSSRGIGAAIAQRLSADGIGVAVTYNQSKEAAARVASACEARGVPAATFAFDAASKQQAQDIVPQVVERFGRLDILVTNAAVLRPGALPEISDDDYEAHMRVNVDHVFYSARAASRVLPQGGRIIVIGSLSADRAPFPGIAAYCATKGAVAAFTRAAARDLGPRGITVNCIQPGAIDTEMNPADGPFSAVYHPESLVDMAALTHGLVAPSLAQLTHTVKTRQVAFERVFGHGMFEHFRIDAAASERFDRNMTRVTSVVSASVVAGYDFSSIRRLVDVGGGRGHFLAAILAANPGIEGVLFDLPDVIERAAPYLRERGLLDRCSLVDGSFLDTIPPRGDAYLLSWVLHDWDDGTCVGVLQRCATAMGDKGRLLVVEHVLQERAGEVPTSRAEIVGALIDVDMLALLPGRERTLAEFRELFAAGGFELASATTLETGVGQRTIMEALPVRR